MESRARNAAMRRSPFASKVQMLWASSRDGVEGQIVLRCADRHLHQRCKCFRPAPETESRAKQRCDAPIAICIKGANEQKASSRDGVVSQCICFRDRANSQLQQRSRGQHESELSLHVQQGGRSDDFVPQTSCSRVSPKSKTDTVHGD